MLRGNLAKLLAVFVFSFVSSCTLFEDPDSQKSDPFINKWYNGKTAAISLTYDSGWPMSDHDLKLQEYLLNEGLTIDYELISYEMADRKRAFVIEELHEQGFAIFGHGHRHVNHDVKSYEQAYEGFRKNYEIMKDMGITPISYAYPGGYGFEDSTVQALKDAGFISSRMHRTADHADPWIMPGDSTAPADWFRLPSIVMQDYEANENEHAVNDNDELTPFLDGAIEKKAWIILSYHSIGNPEGWGFYRMEEFKKGIEDIQKRDFWIASMNDITLYTMQRNAADLDVDYPPSDQAHEGISVKLDHDLDPALFDHKMTVTIPLPEEFQDRSLQLTHDGEVLDNHNAAEHELMINIPPSASVYEITPQ